MGLKNAVGIDKAQSQVLVGQLNSLLANYQVHYQNLRGAHWNITGPSFFELHAKFEELYTKAQVVIDEIAERILTLEGVPLHSFSDYLANATVQERKDLRTAKDTVSGVVADMGQLLTAHRSINALAGEAGDDATATLIGDNITALEKDLWMLNAYNAAQ